MPVTKPTMFCLHCRHPLDGLASRQCPECRRAFDPVDPNTYATSPRRRVCWEPVAAVVCAVLAPCLGLPTFGWPLPCPWVETLFYNITPLVFGFAFVRRSWSWRTRPARAAAISAGILLLLYAALFVYAVTDIVGWSEGYWRFFARRGFFGWH